MRKFVITLADDLRKTINGNKSQIEVGGILIIVGVDGSQLLKVAPGQWKMVEETPAED